MYQTTGDDDADNGVAGGLRSLRIPAAAGLALPAVDLPTISINATLPGASPETMAASVASPIERQLSTIAGISTMTSASALGTTNITVQFDLDRNIDGAALDVQTALTVAQRRLPIEMAQPPSFRKVNPGDFPVISPQPQLRDAADVGGRTRPASLFSCSSFRSCRAVAQVSVYGGQKFAVRVQADPVAAAARNISLDDIRNVLAKTNSNAPVGTITGDRQNVTLTASGAISKAEEYKQVVVASRIGAPVKLEEVARVIDSVENNRVASFFNDRRSVVLAVQRQPRRQYRRRGRFDQGETAALSLANPGGDQHGRVERPFGLDPGIRP